MQNLSNVIVEYCFELVNWLKMKMVSFSVRVVMGIKYNNMMLQVKEVYNFGVLNGLDLDILISVIIDLCFVIGVIMLIVVLDSQVVEFDRIMFDIGVMLFQRCLQDVKFGKSGDVLVGGGWLIKLKGGN